MGETRRWAKTALFSVGFVLMGCGKAQIIDVSFVPRVDRPAYPAGAGPVVAVDEGHFNFHTIGGRYRHFAELLKLDGYAVVPVTDEITGESLSSVDVLVVSNALAEQNSPPGGWSLPNPSAFTAGEIEAVRRWVEAGGALLLIADHMPFPGAASDLAGAFGFRLNNGFAFDGSLEQGPGDVLSAIRQPAVFRRNGNGLTDHPITEGRSPAERVDHVLTFTGQAFEAGKDAEPLLVLGPAWITIMPSTVWEFTEQTPRKSAGGWLQGAALRFGEGRVAVFGEAAMFTAQRASGSGKPMGMNHPQAGQNSRFVLNVLHWLSGLIDQEVSS